ncbi:MAG: hypothetical protein OEZ10_08755 [Gammaproteobacteria bacterium]|nr:hypothetical protein [Gammaproteobacteria bacterium]
MNQSKIESLVEVTFNVSLGFVVSLAFWTWFVVPVYELPVKPMQNLEITGLFTALAIARGFVVRRVFNSGLHRAARKVAARITTGG